MDIILIIHSLLRWLIVLFGLLAVIRALKGVTGKSPFTPADNKAGLFYMIFLDIQLLVGLVLYFVSSKVIEAAMGVGMGGIMKNSELRFWAVEHVTMAIIAIALAHVGRSKVKKAVTDAEKHKKGLVFYGLSFIVIIALVVMVAGKGRGWLPNFGA